MAIKISIAPVKVGSPVVSTVNGPLERNVYQVSGFVGQVCDQQITLRAGQEGAQKTQVIATTRP
jgi:hypothetical protein